MQKKNILKTRFIELTGSFFNTDNTCQTQQDYAFQYALKHELDYLLINDRQEVNHHNLTTIPVNKIDSINDKIELFNYDKQVYYSTNPIKTKSQNNYPLYRIYDKPNFKKIHLFNKEISIPQYKRFLKYHRINILINEDLYI